MSRHYDTLIVGAGIMGSAAASELARRGQTVLLVDRFTPPHEQGSSHGETRVIREAYFEDPAYVPLIQRAYELWDELERQTDDTLLTLTGGLMIGPPDGTVFRGAKRSAEQHQLPHEILNAKQVNERYPALQVPEHMSAVYEPRAGMLFAESCHRAFLSVASQHGVEFAWNSTIDEWHAQEQQVKARLNGQPIEAETLVLATGAWMPESMRSPQLHLTVERQVLHWFDPGASASVCAPDRFPVHLWEYSPEKYVYALPDAGSGVKAALHHQGLFTTTDEVDRTVSIREQMEMQKLISRHLPALSSPPMRSKVCLYTNTANGHFIIDRHPDHRNVFLLSPCSGHGFKFAPVIGEIAADLAMGRDSGLDISRFRVAAQAIPNSPS